MDQVDSWERLHLLCIGLTIFFLLQTMRTNETESGKELSLRLKYVVMPFVGAMQAYEIVSEKTFTMPNNYTS